MTNHSYVTVPSGLGVVLRSRPLETSISESGIVTATARPFHIGRRSHVWSIEIRDEEQRLVCVSRLTMAVVDRPVAGGDKAAAAPVK